MPDSSEILEPPALAARPGSTSTLEEGHEGPVRVLLVEDDPGDALLVEELLSETDLDVELDRAMSVAEALPRLHRADCVLLDLALPDSFGLDGLRALLAADGQVAVVVLTGLADRRRGALAVASGAQDYLIKAEVDASLLGRSVRYAIERRRADVATRRLLEANLRREANERIQRGLLPRPLLRSDDSWPSSSGRDAEAPRPGLILLDLNLPRVDGREVLARIKAEEQLRRIPVVVLTTSEAEEDILRSYDLHANAYVTKPVDFEAFVNVVRQVGDFYINVVRLPPR